MAETRSKLHRTAISDDIEDAMQRLLDESQNLQRRIFRINRRGFVTARSSQEIVWAVENLARDANDIAGAAQTIEDDGV